MGISCFDSAFPTLFMPIVVPEEPSEEESHAVVECFRAFLDATTSDREDRLLFPNDVSGILESMRSISKAFCDLHGGSNHIDLTPSLIHSSLQGLRPDGYWGMWVPAQNGVLLLHRVGSNNGTEDIARVYVWEAQAPNIEVMENNEPIRQACPRIATSVPWNRIIQPSVAELLSELATTTPEKAKPKSRKAGEEHHETREAIKPMYLTEFFLSALGGHAIPAETIQGVHKKMRDKVIYSGGDLPWRRAPIWTALKGLMHVVCVMETTKVTNIHAVNSQLMYKIVIQNFLAFCLNNSNEISASATVEGARKISRRIAKVETLYEKPLNEHLFFETSTNFCGNILKEKMNSCGDDWKKKCEKSVRCDVDLSKINPENDIRHKLKSSLPVLEELVELKNDFFRMDTNGDIPEPSGRRLLADQDMCCELLEAHIVEIKKTFKCWKNEPQDAIGQLNDVAISVSKFFVDITRRATVFLDSLDKANCLVVPLIKLLNAYSEKGLEMYAKDPRGCGEIVLVSLMVVLIIDMLACEHHPILKEHKLGIDPSFLQYILLSTVKNKKLLLQLENYINERSAKNLPSSIEPNRSETSLSVRYALRNPHMMKDLASIQKECELDQKKKESERQTKQIQYDNLQNLIRREGWCSCEKIYDSCGHYSHTVTCRRCELVSKADNIKMDCYEKLLPPGIIEQCAVVFELRQPELLTGQRSAILLLFEKFFCEDWCKKTDIYLWSGESRLDKWRKNTDDIFEICELGSTRKKISSSHYHRNIHVTHRFSFVVEHDYHTLLMGSKGKAKDNLKWEIKPDLYSVELEPSSRYKSLEIFFNSFHHSENEVIAAKSLASEEISLIEFEKIGALRAGPRHQLVRLCSSLVQKNISLEKEEIVSLIRFTLWQAGPPCSNNIVLNGGESIPVQLSPWYRQQAEFLQASEFVKNLCDQLLSTIDGCTSNWANQNILLNVTYIAMHVFEHVRLNSNAVYSNKNNVEVTAKIVDFITKCRRIAKEWIRMLIIAFDEATDDSDKQRKRERISYVAAIGTFTFADSDDLLSTGDDIGLWIFFRVLFNSNFTPAQLGKGLDSRSHFLHSFVVAEAIEPRLQSLLGRDKLGLDNFLELYGETGFGSNDNTARNWKQCKARHWFRMDYNDGTKKQVVQVDIIAGYLLVNGMPPKSLPRSITAHKIFSRLFGKSTFMVRPTLSNFGYRTLSEVDGYFYEFYPPSDPPREDRFKESPIIIKECEKLRVILVPWYMFEGDLPEQLVNDYSHWFVLDAPIDGQIVLDSPIDGKISEDCVYFGPRSYKTRCQFLDTTSYILDCNERLVFETKTKHKFIDIRSETFEELYSKVFSRLSSKLKVHVSVSPSIGDPLMIKIPVLQNIRFVFDKKSDVIRSNDFRSLRVSKDQNFGCLVGIQHGLLLEGVSNFENKVFLCPHGGLSRSKDGTVKIDIHQIRSPAFFRFEVRPELRDLRSCTSDTNASLFLAQLHAVTSGILADPFTGTTGTQRALTILRSGHCSGNLIYSFEKKDIEESMIAKCLILSEIASISYCREDYHSMEKNNSRSSCYDALCANSAFAFQVKILLDNLEDALKVMGMDRKTITSLNEAQVNLALRTSNFSRRAYFQYREMYPKDSCLSEEEEEQIFRILDRKDSDFLALPEYFEPQTIDLGQKIGFESQNRFYYRSNGSSLISLLCSQTIDMLQGITGAANLKGGPMKCFDSLIDPTTVESANSKKTSFHNVWLNLYHICQSQVENEDKKTSISFLLTWIMMEYPEKETFFHLQQLLMVSMNPKIFPSIREYSISKTSYVKPHGNTYEKNLVDQAIDSHLERFDEREPSQSYHRHRWMERRSRHMNLRHEQAKSIESEIHFQWENGYSKISITSYFSLLTSEHSLEERTDRLFSRWREAGKLQNFIEEVTKQLEGLPVDTCPDFVPLSRDKAVDVLTSRSSFALSTDPQLDGFELDDGSIAELQKIEPYTLSSELLTADQMTALHTNELSFLKDSNFVNENSDYKEVWDELVWPLEKSFSIACNEPEFLATKFDSLRTEIKKELQEYALRADLTHKTLRSRIKCLFRSEKEKLPFIEIQKNVSLWNSIGPYDLLLLCSKESICNSIKHELVSFALSIKHVQRARRCLRLLNGGRDLRIYLLNDLSVQFSISNTGLNECWNAYENPEFIMFEVDNDIGIRDTQAQVAFEILKEKNENGLTTNNRLMQLNMGEGKTAVIMPIVLARAARGDRLVRATVLSSLYTTNCSDWQYKLGGLLSRRVYPMLCRRDLPLGAKEAEILLERCRKIKNKKHIIVTVPEHRLSLENKAIELASDLTMAKNLDTSKNLHEVVKFLWQNAREFLDESDEILSPKYQLIYTIGAPRDMEGSQLRWEIHAFIYESLRRHAPKLQKFGPDVIELGKSMSSVQETEYMGLRLLEGSKQCEEAYNTIKKLIVDDVLNDYSKMKIKLRKEELQKWKSCVTGGGRLDDLEGLPNDSKVIALCLRGMLEHNVLKIVLFKRWRVHYGNHPTRKGFNMAVPYRAKDVAAERTEFGHPDVALSLTFAHYFQAGLQRKELRDAFERLKNMSDSDAKAEYSSWVGSGQMKKKTERFPSYEGVNIEDSTFFEHQLYPTFRCNMRVIRFWLVKIVLPVQAKQFPKRLSSTAPDLCRSPQLGKFWTSVTTGFSGTDDLRLLLPPTIVQANLKNLEKTNGVQLMNILREENNHYSHFIGENSTTELLEKLLHIKSEKSHVQKINVVLDSGALVLHKSNREFAKSWLGVRKDMDAAAFFEGSSRFVLTRDGARLTFDASPYCEDMSKCLLYLDEIHTRGSDFRLPLNTRAIITLGKGLQKDKFVQACMRMRQLGRGQSLLFVASHEVHRVLEADFSLNMNRNNLGFVSAILEWTVSNSVKRICDLMPYFVGQMRSTFLKANAYNQFYDDQNPHLESIADACIEDELLELQQLYGNQYGSELLPTIVNRRLDKRSIFGHASESPSIRDDCSCRSLFGLVDELKERIERLAPRVQRPSSMLDEEQERELEQELEEEIDVERPPAAVPRKPHFSEGLRQVLTQGQYRPELFPELCKKYLFSLRNIFRGTSLSESPMGSQLNTELAFVTKDFVDTVEGKRGKDYFVKNISWFLKWNSAPHDPVVVVVVSNFEAEELSNLLESEIRDLFVDRGRFPSLYAFAAITRLDQPRIFLTESSCEPPVVIHILGGVHADEELEIEIRNFLSVFPRPPTPSRKQKWDALFDDGFICRDSFVCPEHRDHVHTNLSEFDGSKGIFDSSPVKSLRRFYGDFRHLNSELPNSSIGKLLGVSEFVSKSDEDTDNTEGKDIFMI